LWCERNSGSWTSSPGPSRPPSSARDGLDRRVPLLVRGETGADEQARYAPSPAPGRGDATKGERAEPDAAGQGHVASPVRSPQRAGHDPAGAPPGGRPGRAGPPASTARPRAAAPARELAADRPEEDPLDPIHQLVARVARRVDRRDEIAHQPLRLLAAEREVLDAVEQLLARIADLGDPVEQR